MNELQTVNNGALIAQQDISEDMFNRFIQFVDAKPKTVETYTRAIRQLFKYLAEIIEECRESENEMWFVEEDEITEEEAMKISDEVERLGIEDYVRFYEDGCAITIYGGVITRFLF